MHSWTEELAELAVVVVGLFAALSLLSRRHDRWAQGFTRRWLAILLLIAAAAVLVEVTIEVLGHGTTSVQPIDQAILVFIHDAVPDWMLPAFRMATFTGSLKILLPAIVLGAGWLWGRRHRFEGLQLFATTIAAAVVIYLAKTAVGRARPSLWDTQWFWGSSFPSGHTLSTAAVATALCLCVSRLRPRWRWPAITAAGLWVSLVAVSRLVLGVHWPTDVIAAACAGLLMAAGMNGLLTLLGNRTGIRPEGRPE